MAEITLRIEGMHCGSCIRRVTQTIHGVGSVEVEEVRLGAARFRVPEDETAAQAGVAIAALARAGFTARVDE
jgi:copper chaperone